MPEYDERVERTLEKERIFRTEEDLRTFSQYRLRSHFSSGSGRIVMSRLLKSLIWQAYERISVGKEGGIAGEARGLESEAMPLVRLHDLVEESIGKILSAR